MAFNKKKIKALLADINSRCHEIDYDKKLYNIFKGQLLQYILLELGKQLSGESAKIAAQRIPPINVLQRVINKLSKLYSKGVARTVVNGDENDQEALSWYQDQMKPDIFFMLANEYFNLSKRVLVQPFLSGADTLEPTPSMRVIPAHKFIAYSFNPKEAEKPEGIILFMGSHRIERSDVQVYKAIEANQFCYFTEDGDDVTAKFAPENPMGLNELGRIPYVYINRDRERVMPMQDTDIYQMTTLLPILMTDINFSAMFTAFSIMFGIDVDDEGLRFSPNAFWSFKTKPGIEAKPEVGVLKPSADIDLMWNSVANQLAFWLQTRDIKPGSLGDIKASNFSSGVAKMLDEMDTTENREQQIPYFQEAEQEFWDLVLHTLHPEWIKDGMPISFTGEIAATARVYVKYAEQVPLVRRAALIEELGKAMSLKLMTRDDALAELHPTWTASEILAYRDTIALEQSSSTTTSLNGAQVESMAAILERVALGTLPKASAKSVLMQAFGLSDESAEAIIGPIQEKSIDTSEVL